MIGIDVPSSQDEAILLGFDCAVHSNRSTKHDKTCEMIAKKCSLSKLAFSYQPCYDIFTVREDELNIISSLIKSGGGTGPMKPGNRGHAAVPIPAGDNLKDEVCCFRQA